MRKLHDWKGSRLIPLYGMFTRDVNKFRGRDNIDNQQHGLAMAFYHAVITALIILGTIKFIIL